MCFNTKLSKSKQEITKHFNIEPDGWKDIQFNPGNFNAFTHPQTPIICQPNRIETAEWGLIPAWAKDKTIQASTLNARIETLTEKPSFKNSINNRCLIIADGFYEWQWLDAKGNRKQKYLLELPGVSLFTFAGLFSDWTNPATGQPLLTYTIITTEANPLMAQIHNTKKRMPVIVQNEYQWLQGSSLVIANHHLIAHKLEAPPTIQTLF
ncbi:MAG: SOS response-associated peptidase [Breznakibacter sp.]